MFQVLRLNFGFEEMQSEQLDEKRGEEAPKRKGGFQKGQSGNPGGRPRKDFELTAKCREHTPAIVARLFEIVTDKKAKHSDVISAANVLLDRGYGRAPQFIEMNATVDLSIQVEQFIRSLGPPGSKPNVLDAEAFDVEMAQVGRAEPLIAQDLQSTPPIVGRPDIVADKEPNHPDVPRRATLNFDFRDVSPEDFEAFAHARS